MEGTAALIEDGFNFDLSRRNEFLKEKIGKNTSSTLPKERKTGTTIVGIKYKDGVVLGADTRATAGTTVFDKNCLKIHYIADNIYCCGAGTAADTEQVTRMISSQMKLLKLETGMQSRLVECVSLTSQYLFKYQGHVSAALVLGGVDFTGSHIYHIHPHGSAQELPYATMGSGSLAAMSVFETEWRPNLEEEEAKQLVRKAIRYGIFNDLGSGGNVDLCVIKDEAEKTKGEILRTFDQANVRLFRKLNPYQIGPTAVMSETVEQLKKNIVVEDVSEEVMDTDE